MICRALRYKPRSSLQLVKRIDENTNSTKPPLHVEPPEPLARPERRARSRRAWAERRVLRAAIRACTGLEEFSQRRRGAHGGQLGLVRRLDVQLLLQAVHRAELQSEAELQRTERDA